jgi:hypothetical protein
VACTAWPKSKAAPETPAPAPETHEKKPARGKGE